MRTQIIRLIDKLGAFAHTDARSIAKGGFWLTLGSLIELGLGMITIILLANLIDKETLGTYQFVISIATILGAFTLTGLATTVITETAKGNDGALWSGMRAKLRWNIGIALASFLVALYYFINDNTLLGNAFLIVGTLSPFIESFHLYQPYVVGKQAYKFNTFLGIIRKLAPMAALLGTLYFTQEILALIAAYFIGHLSAVILNYILTFQHFRPVREDTFKNKTLFSKHLSVMQLAGRIAEHIDKVLVFHHLGAVAVATYTIAQMPTKYTKNFLSTIRALVLPKVSQRDFTTLQHTLPRKVWILFGLVAAIVLVYIVLAPFVFTLAFPEYPESILVSQVLALSILVFPFSVYGHTLTAHEKTKWLYILRIGGVSLKLILLYTLLPIYDIWGAVYAILISELINNLLLVIIFRRIS